MATFEKRKGKDGQNVWRVKVRRKGVSTMSATFARLTDARNWAKLTEAAILEGRHFGTKESKRRTVADAIDRYLEQVLPSKSPGTVRGQLLRLRWWRKELGDRLLADMTTALLVEYRDTLSARYAAATVHFFLSVLSHVFTIAVREWEWMEENPLHKVSRPKLPRGHVRFLSDAEREAAYSVRGAFITLSLPRCGLGALDWCAEK